MIDSRYSPETMERSNTHTIELELRPLVGHGPWTLVDVADAAGVSYDRVYRDVRNGVLGGGKKPKHPGRSLHLVTTSDLRSSGRSCYRHLVLGTHPLHEVSELP